jgi:L-2-hydroxyglutarate oxidase LhgO
MLYAFRQELNVPHRSCGKFLIAVADAEIEKLAAIKAQAEANRVTDLVWLSEASALEPALVARRALLSPSTGIIDSHAFMLALRGDAERHGAMVALKTPVVSGRTTKRGLGMGTGGACPMEIEASLVVNAEGLGAQKLARSIKGMPADKAPPLHLAMGTYFWLASARPFRALSTRCRPGGTRHASHPRPRRPGPVRAGRRMGGSDRLCGRSSPSRFVLRRDPNPLARPA